MHARLITTTLLVAIAPLAARAATPFADYCEGNICFQAKVQRGCLTQEAKRLMRTISDRFGKIEIASACDGRHARRSAHYVGKAFDFRPFGGARAEIVAFLKGSPDVGGVGTYPNGLIHADVGDRKMAWHGRGGRAWPIGIDRTPSLDEPAASPSASPTGGLAALMAAFNPPSPASAPAPLAASPEQTPPLDAAGKAPLRVPLPPARPAVLASVSTGVADAAPDVGDAAILPGFVAASSPPRITVAAYEPFDFAPRPERLFNTATFREVPPPPTPTFAASTPPASPTAAAVAMPGSDFMIALRGGLAPAEFAPPKIADAAAARPLPLSSLGMAAPKAPGPRMAATGE